MEKQIHMNRWRVLVAMATEMMPRGRSGAMSPAMDLSFSPDATGKFIYMGRQSTAGKIRHAGQVRRIKKAQRRRQFLRSLRRR